MNKTNDWVAAQLNAPMGVTLADFYANGITPENTGINEREYYKSIPKVQEAFTKDEEFDERSYNQFYDDALRSYNYFSNEKFAQDYVKQAARHKYDWFNFGSPIMDDRAVMLQTSDKNRHSHGLSNIWHKGKPTFSDREVAQANFVRDENGNILDWTPNEGGIFKNIFGPALALAIWEEDGYHEINGDKIQHYKGELKLDETGDPFVEIVKNKDGYGRDFVRWSDVLTEEGSAWNKWDPFDSDSLDKGILSTISLTALKVAPFFIPNAGPWLGGIAAVKGLATVVPTVGKAVSNIIAGGESGASKAFTNWENFMERFSETQSDAGRATFFNTENIGNIFSTSFSQLASQRLIGNIPRLLNPATKNTELGRQLALGYMAATSAQDSYGAFKEAGANDVIAGLGMAASMASMFGLMNVNYYKDWVFRDTWLDEEAEFRRNFKEFAKYYAREEFGTPVVKPDLNTVKGKFQASKIYQKFFKKVGDFTSKYIIDRVKDSSTLVSALNEGFEESLEEVLMDTVKALSLGLEALGFKVTEDPTQKLDFGFSGEDFASRYAAAFVGGAIGGAAFDAYGKWENYLTGNMSRISDIKDLNERMAWYAMNGYQDKMLEMVDRDYKKGRLPANKNLSAIPTDFVESADETNASSSYDKRVYGQGTATDNQALKLYNILRTHIESINYTLNEHIMLRSDGEILNNFSQKALERLQEEADKEGLSLEEYRHKYFKDIQIEALKDSGLLDAVLRDTKRVSRLIYETGIALRKAKLDYKDASDDTKDVKAQVVQDLEKRMKSFVDNYNKITSGELAGKYIGQALYTVNGPLIESYLNQTKSGSEYYPQTDVRYFTEWKYDLDFDSLSDPHKDLILEEFHAFADKGKLLEHLYQIREVHYNLTTKFADKINAVGEAYKGYKIDPFWERDAILNTEIRDQQIHYLEGLVDAMTKQQQSNEVENPILTESIAVFKEELALLKNEVTPLAFRSSLTDYGVSALGKLINFNVLDDDSRMLFKQQLRNFYTKLQTEKIITPYDSLLLEKYLDLEASLTKDWDFEDGVVKVSDFKFHQEYDGEADPFGDRIHEYQLSGDEEVRGYLASQAKLFWQEIVKNPQNARAIVNNMVAKLRSTELNWDKSTPEQFVYTLLGTSSKDLFLRSQTSGIIPLAELQEYSTIDVAKLLDFLDEIAELRRNTKTPNVKDFLREIGLNIHGRRLNILDVLTRESSDLQKLTEIEDYIIDETSLDELRAALQTTQVAMALIMTATDGTNKAINLFQSDKFAELEESQGILLINDLGLIQSRLSKLIQLAEGNEQSLVSEQQDIAVNMLPKFIKSLVNPSIDDDDEKLLTGIFNDLFGETESGGNFLQKLWGDFDLDTVTPDNFAQFYSQVILFGTKLHQAYNERIKAYGSPTNFGKELATKLNDAGITIKFRNTHLTKDNSEQVSLYDSLIYFLTLAGADSTDFVKKLYSAVKSENAILPYFSQEFAVQTIWARTHNNELFDGFINTIALRNPNASTYISEMVRLNNFIMVDGAAGVGKSTGVGRIIWNILKSEGYDIIVASNVEDRAKALQNTLEIGDEQCFTINELFTKMLGKDYEIADYVDKFESDKGLVIDTSKLDNTSISDSEIFTNDALDKKLIIIDEVTLLDEVQLQLLEQYTREGIHKGNLTILALGDSGQNSVSITLDGVTKTSGIEDFFYVSVPHLTASLRKTCRAKKVNLQLMRSILDRVLEWRTNDPSVDDKELSTQIQEVINNYGEILNLKYTWDGGFFGEMFTNDPKSHVESLVRLLDEGEKLAILVDNDGFAEYADIQSKYSDKIELYNSEEIQGGQFKYVLIDKTFDSDPNNKRNTLKDFYTAISRSTTGTIIGTAKYDIRELFGGKLNSIESPDAGAIVVNPEDPRYENIAAKYREWRMGAFPAIARGTAGTPTTATVSSEGESGEEEAKEIVPTKAPESASKISKKDYLSSLDRIKHNISAIKPPEITLEALLQEILEGDGDSWWEQQYRQRVDAVENGHDVIDAELLNDWLESSPENFKTFMDNLGLDYNNKRHVEDFKQSIRVFSGILLEHDIVDGKIQIHNQGVIDTITVPILKQAINNFNGHLEWFPRKNDSVLLYCFEAKNPETNNLEKKVVPLAISNNHYKGVVPIVNERIATRHTNILPIYSKGRIWTRIREVLGDKIPSGRTFGVFRGDKTKVSSIYNLTRGKTYIPLQLWGLWFDEFEKDYFVPQGKYIDRDDNNKPVERYKWATQGYSEGLLYRGVMAGIQKTLDFKTFLEYSHYCYLLNTNADGDIEKALSELEAFLGTKAWQIYHTRTTNAQQDAEENADKPKYKLLDRSRVKSLVSSIIRFFSQVDNQLVKDEFFTKLNLIINSMENRKGYKTGLTFTVKTKRYDHDIVYFLENVRTENGSEFAIYKSIGGYNNFELIGNTPNFTDGKNLGIIDIYKLASAVLNADPDNNKEAFEGADLVPLENGTTLRDVMALNNFDDKATREAWDLFFKNESIIVGLDTRYRSSSSDDPIKYFPINESVFLQHILYEGPVKEIGIRGETNVTNSIINQLAEYIDTETVFRHGMYCNIVASHGGVNVNWDLKRLSSEPEENFYKWDIAKVFLPIYIFNHPESATTMPGWSTFLNRNFSDSVENKTLDGIYEGITFTKEGEFLIPKDSDNNTIRVSIQNDVSDEWANEYLGEDNKERYKNAFIIGIKSDGSAVQILTPQGSAPTVELVKKLNTTKFNVTGITDVVGNITVGDTTYDILINKDKITLNYGEKNYPAKLVYVDGRQAYVVAVVDKSQVVVKIPYSKLNAELKQLTKDLYAKQGAFLEKLPIDKFGNIYFFKKDNSYFISKDLNTFEPIKLKKSGQDFYIFKSTGEFLFTTPVNDLWNIIDSKPNFINNSKLITSDNVNYVTQGNLRVDGAYLMSVTTNAELANGEYEIFEINLKTKKIIGSFGELDLAPKITTIEDLNIRAGNITFIETGTEGKEFIKLLNKNSTIKLVLGENTPKLNSNNLNEITEAYNEALKNKRFDVGKWWVITLRDGKITLRTIKNSETLLGKELKDSRIRGIVDIEVTKGAQGWKNKEVLVTLQDGTVQKYALFRDNRRSRWQISKIEATTSQNSHTHALLDSVRKSVQELKDLKTNEGTSLINPDWIKALELKLESFITGDDVSEEFAQFSEAFLNYNSQQLLLNETDSGKDPYYNQIVEALSPILKNILNLNSTVPTPTDC